MVTISDMFALIGDGHFERSFALSSHSRHGGGLAGHGATTPNSRGLKNPEILVPLGRSSIGYPLENSRLVDPLEEGDVRGIEAHAEQFDRWLVAVRRRNRTDAGRDSGHANLAF
jgi:hypothetical protein